MSAGRLAKGLDVTKPFFLTYVSLPFDVREGKRFGGHIMPLTQKLTNGITHDRHAYSTPRTLNINEFIASLLRQESYTTLTFDVLERPTGGRR